MNRTFRGSVRMLIVLGVLASSMTQTVSHASSNLVRNPGFEVSHLPPDVVELLFNQPVWPVGWLAEGATALFDHTPHNTRGNYSAQISGSYSGPRRDCSLSPCTNIPGGDVKDTVYQHYTLAPAWRSELPFAVQASKSYTFRAWMRLAIPKDGTGARTMVRWFNALGVPIGTSPGPKLIAGIGGSSYLTFANGTFVNRSTDWTEDSVTVTSPANAASAVLVLAHTDDAWIGSVVYDDICFALTVAAIC